MFPSHSLPNSRFPQIKETVRWLTNIILLNKALLSNKRSSVSKLSRNIVQKDLPEEQ